MAIAIPKLIYRLFGLDSVYKSNHIYSSYPYNSNLVQMFQSFGIGGIIPLIMLKAAYTLSSLVYELQKYPFIKNFLIPGGVVAVVSGLIVFLIYWLQPNYYGTGYSSYQTQPYGYSQNSYKGGYGYSQNSHKADYSYDGYNNHNSYPTSGSYYSRNYQLINDKPSNYHNVYRNSFPNQIYRRRYNDIANYNGRYNYFNM